MKRVLIVVFAALLPAFHLQAQDEAFGWMCQRNDPVSVAMAGVSLAPSSDISFSAFRNPAVIPYSESRFAVTAAYSPAVGDMTTDGLDVGVGMKTGERLGFSVAGNYNSCGEYEVIDDSGNRNGMFKTSSMMFSAGWGLKVIDALSVGINLKYAGERLASDSNQGVFASDVYALYRWRMLRFSAGLANVGTSVKDASGSSYHIPSSVRLAAGYGQTFEEKHSLEAGMDADCFFAGKFAVSGGVQYGFNGMVFARVGYRASGSDVIASGVSAGLGCKFHGVRVDFAYQRASSLNILAFSLGYSF